MKRSHRMRLGLMVLVAGSLLAAAASWASSNTPNLTRAQHHTLWVKNIEQIEKARTAPVREPGDHGGGAATDPVSGWLSKYRSDLSEIEAAKRKDYETYVERGKAHLEKKEIRESLVEAQRALKTAFDEEALLSSGWIHDLEAQAAELAKQYREAGKWRKALSVYYSLTGLFEKNKEYEKARADCLNIARLNALYGKDGRWKEVLEGIDSENAVAALDRIERYYVEEAKFRDVTAAGIEHLLLLSESEEMRKGFDGLGDQELREDFNSRLRRRLEQVRDGETGKFRAKDAQEHFRRILQINAQSVRLPEELIVYEFMDGALEPLDDFTSVIWPIEFREFDKHTRGGFVGVGISIQGGGDRPVTVVTPLEDTPAYRAGILPDDQISHVNGESLEGMSLNKVVQMITGPVDTEVTLTIHRPTEKRDIEFKLTRAQVEIQSVKGWERNPEDRVKWNFMVDAEQGIGYARVNSFQENTVDQLQAGIDDMIAHGGRGLILDLRFNPGGLMKAAIEMCQLFLTRDELVVSTKGDRDPPWQNPKPDSDGPFTNLPLIVLVNEYSASASEIVSGALQDHERALIVGNRTFGKFSVQKLMQLSGGIAHLKLTTARYYLPSGRMLHHDEGATQWGVMPDIDQKTVPKELMRVREIWRDRDVLVLAPKAEKVAEDELASAKDAEKDSEKSGDKEATPVDEGDEEGAVEEAVDADDEEKLQLAEDPNELPEIDLQLEMSLVLMRLHLNGESELRVAAAEKAESEKTSVRNP